VKSSADEGPRSDERSSGGSETKVPSYPQLPSTRRALLIAGGWSVGLIAVSFIWPTMQRWPTAAVLSLVFLGWLPFLVCLAITAVRQTRYIKATRRYVERTRQEERSRHAEP
jgi:hypothetical protein